MRALSARATLAAAALRAAVERRPSSGSRGGSLHRTLPMLRGGGGGGGEGCHPSSSSLSPQSPPRPARACDDAYPARACDDDYRVRSVAHHRGGPGSSLCLDLRFVLSPPSPTLSSSRWRQSLASFSTSSVVVKKKKKNEKNGGRVDYIALNQRISRAKDLRDVLSVVRESHRNFRPRDASLACHRISTHMGKKGQTIRSVEDVATVQLAIEAAVSKAGEMNAQDVANTLWAFGNFAEKGVKVDAAAVRAVSDAAVRVASNMNAQDVSNTLLSWSRLGSAESGIEVDAAAVRAVSDAAVRVASNMNAQAVSNTLLSWSRLGSVESGIEVDAVALRAVSDAAVRVASNMNAQAVSNTLLSWSRLGSAESGIEVDAAAVRAVSDAAVRVASDMNAQEVANTLLSWSRLGSAESGIEVDAVAVRAVSDAAVRVASDMNAQEVANTLRAWGKMVANGNQLASIIDKSSWLAVVTRAKAVHPDMTAQGRGMIRDALDIITKAASEKNNETTSVADGDTHPHPTPERASAAFWAAAERWKSKLPDGKRAKLESALSAAGTEEGKVQLLVASAEADTTKVRAAVKRALLHELAI